MLSVRGFVGVGDQVLIQGITGSATCLQYAGLSQAQGTAFLFHGKVRLQPLQRPDSDCPWLIMDEKNLPLLSDKINKLGWDPVVTVQRPADRNERILVFRSAKEQSPDALGLPALTSD